MSCRSLRKDIINALIAESEGKIQKARMNAEVYLHNPVGIGEHPDLLAAVQELLFEEAQLINITFADE